jgi:uncharacterized protein
VADRTARKPRQVNCPQCGALVLWERASPYRPFCSARCKMLDLGAWATESYRIPVAEDKDIPEDDAGSPSANRN